MSLHKGRNKIKIQKGLPSLSHFSRITISHEIILRVSCRCISQKRAMNTYPWMEWIYHSFKQTKPLASLISLVSSLIIICNHNHFGGRPGVNLAKQLLIANSGLFKCMKMIPCSSYMYDGSNILCSFFLQAACQGISFPCDSDSQ